MAEEYLSTSRCAAGAPERESSHELHELHEMHELIELQQRKKKHSRPATWQPGRASSSDSSSSRDGPFATLVLRQSVPS